MPTIRKLKKKDEREVKNLLNKLTSKPINLKINSLIRDKKCHCIVMEHSKSIIGFGSLIIYQVPTKGHVARLEDIVIHDEYRGKGYGRKLTHELILIAKKKKIKTINLTSHPKRVEARNLYKSMGFELLETGIFKLEL